MRPTHGNDYAPEGEVPAFCTFCMFSMFCTVKNYDILFTPSTTRTNLVP